MRPTALRSVSLAAAVVGPAPAPGREADNANEESGTFAVPAPLRAARLPLTSAHVALVGGAHAAKPVPPEGDAKDPTQQSLWTEQAAQPRSRGLSPLDRAVAVGLDRHLALLQAGDGAARWSNRAVAARAEVDPGKITDWRKGRVPNPAYRLLLAMGREEAVRCVEAMFDARREAGR